MVAIPAGFTPEEYLALEKNAQHRHEFRCGRVYAMAGGSDSHNRIAINLSTALNLHFEDDRCQFFVGDIKLNHAERFYYYPDVFVTCDPRDREDIYIKRYPKLIAEVLSSSTMDFDREEKFDDYRRFESLEEYLLISQKVQQVELFRRSQDWRGSTLGADDRLVLASIDLELEVSSLYRGTSVPVS